MAEIRDYVNNPDPQTAARWPEGMAMSTVNDTGRVDEGILGRWEKDINTSLVSTGTSTAYTITPNRDLVTGQATPLYEGLTIGFTAHVTNGESPTLDVQSTGAKPLINSAGVAIVAGTVPQNGKVIAFYSSAYDSYVVSSIEGAESVSFTQRGTGAETRNVDGRLKETMSLFDFIPPSEHSAIIARTATNGHGADINEAIAAAISEDVGVLDVPSGDFNCDIPLIADTGAGLTINGKGSDILNTNSLASRFLITHSGTGLLVNPNAGLRNSYFADGETNLIRTFSCQNMSFWAGSDTGAPPIASRGLEVRNCFEQPIFQNLTFRGFSEVGLFLNNVWNARVETVTVRGSWFDGTITGVHGVWGYNANSVYCINSYMQILARRGVGFRFMGAEAGTLLASQTDKVGIGVWVDTTPGKFTIDQHWAEQCRNRYPGQVVDFTITDGGSGYTSAPDVTLGAPSAGGAQATAVSEISGGVVSRVYVIDPGDRYTGGVPTVSFSGGGGSGAAATAILTDAQASANMVAPLIMATSSEGVEIRSGHLIWGGDTGLGETIEGYTAHVWGHNTQDVVYKNSKLIGGGSVRDGIWCAVARADCDRWEIRDSCRTETAGFVASGRTAPSDGTIQVSLDDEFSAIRFPDDIQVTLNANQFAACLGSPTKGPQGTPEDTVEVWTLPDAQNTGVQAWVNMPTTRFTPINRALTPFLTYATDTAAGNEVRLAARPALFSEGDDFRNVPTVYRERPESTVANGLMKRTLSGTANWTVLPVSGNISANIVCLRDGANAADTSTGNFYLIGAEVRIQKDKWTV